MNINEYQKLASRTLIDKPQHEISDKEIMIVWFATGLAGESGEVVDHIKKGIFHQHGIERDKIKKELGDVLWYVAGLCTKLGMSMEEVMIDNIQKLELRYPDGFNSEDSKSRRDVSLDLPTEHIREDYPKWDGDI